MNKMVIDASVVLKWFSKEGEELAKEAREIHKKIVNGKIEVWAPELLLTEVLNILARKKKLENKWLNKIMGRLNKMRINWVSMGADEILGLAKIVGKYKVTAYDGQYLWLAKEKKCKLLTLDKELLKIKGLAMGLENRV
ncbi:MAG: type II toxin-antitoxin system VapC family toxin [Candidatus Beckwithbacteria bacterium]|nr:type II toxin-antitoxin system VapC family toxin [Patescibacteria group bacterium]